jgi:cytochrome b involved in lipid metabolism
MTATLTQTVQRPAIVAGKKHKKSKQTSFEYPIKASQYEPSNNKKSSIQSTKTVDSFALAKRGYAVPLDQLSPNTKKYTWQQVAQHNNADSCWMYINHTVYDVTSWLDRHPGGRHILLLSAGRDVTDLFESYHPFTQLPHKRIIPGNGDLGLR